jgi:hypothetical protein
VILVKGPPAKPLPPKVIIQKVPQPVPVSDHEWR